MEFAAVAWGGVELEGNPALIKFMSQSIQSSIRNNERKGDSDEPDAPLLLERELAVGEVDVVIGREQSNQANNTADDGFNQRLAVKAKPPPGRHQVHTPSILIHVTQPGPITAQQL